MSCHHAPASTSTTTPHESVFDGVSPPPLPSTVSDLCSPSEDKARRRAKFEAVFETIREELLDHFAGQKMPVEAVDWYRNVSKSFFHICI